MEKNTDTPQPLVSVVLPILSPEPQYFRQSVLSIMQQSLSNFELIIVEKPSSFQITEAIGDLLDDPRVIHVLAENANGLVDQLNLGIKLAKAEFIARMDADDLSINNRIQVQVEYLRNNPDVDVIGSSIIIIDQNDKEIGFRRYPITNNDVHNRFCFDNPFAHPSVLFRKKSVETIGGYRETGYPVEDYDLWSRLAKSGSRMANHPTPLLKYRFHSGASKLKSLKPMLAGTIVVKNNYWRKNMGVLAVGRLLAEELSMALPSRLIWGVFKILQGRKASS